MPCYYPLKAYSQAGKIRFSPLDKCDLLLPCGQCIGCRLEYARQWAVRCYHENIIHNAVSQFITLTYAPEHLPSNGWLVKRDVQLFIKRLRKKIEPIKIRYFGCGEYGFVSCRPHYHIAIFGFEFPDLRLWKVDKGFALYNSESLDALWGYGYAVIGNVTYESSGYVARYMLKKQKGKNKDLEYELDVDTGEMIIQPQEYSMMSRRPGIGADFFYRYYSDIYPKDEITVNGREMRPPKYYDKLLKRKDIDLYEKIKEKRLKKVKEQLDNYDNHDFISFNPRTREGATC